MKNQITSRDIERLSAYLDNQLDGKERARLEERLIADRELRRELQELEKTRLLLRELPRLRAPRNFVNSSRDNLKTGRASTIFQVIPNLWSSFCDRDHIVGHGNLC